MPMHHTKGRPSSLIVYPVKRYRQIWSKGLSPLDFSLKTSFFPSKRKQNQDLPRKRWDWWPGWPITAPPWGDDTEILATHSQSSFQSTEQLGYRDGWSALQTTPIRPPSQFSPSALNLTPADVRMRMLKWRKLAQDTQLQRFEIGHFSDPHIRVVEWRRTL